MQNSSQGRRRNSAPESWRNSTPPPPKPRGGPSALAGERSEPIWLGVRDHTRSLCAQSPAQTEQWCCWIGRRRIIFGSAEIAAILAISATQIDDPCVREHVCQIPVRTAYPHRRSSDASSLWWRGLADPTGIIPTSQIHGSRTDI